MVSEQDWGLNADLKGVTVSHGLLTSALLGPESLLLGLLGPLGLQIGGESRVGPGERNGK